MAYACADNYSATADTFDAPALSFWNSEFDQVREETVRFFRENSVTAVETNVIYAISTKPRQ